MSLIAIGYSTDAQAQSNLIIYGYLDIGLTKESGATTRVSKGYNNWLGFKGGEDLGSDLAAIFNVQLRFNPDTGAQERSTTLIQGETTVGLKSKQFGTLRLGRALTPLWAEKWAYDPWYDSGFMGSLASYNGDFNSDGFPSADYHDYARAANAVFYSSPNISGFQLHVEAELELPTGAKTHSKGFSVNYAKGPLSLMLAYEKNHVEDNIVYLAGTYSKGNITITGTCSRSNLTYSPMRFHSALLAGTHTIGSGTVRAGYGRTKENSASKFSTGYAYAFSKRTNVYTDIYREKISAASNGFALGINHTF